MLISKPGVDEYKPYAEAYINKLPDDGQVMEHLHNNMNMVLALVGSLTEEQLNYRYAPGKWSIKEVLIHIADTERIFAYRALRIGRGDTTPLPGFEQDDYVPASQAANRVIKSIVDEYESVRRATLTLLNAMPPAAFTNVTACNNAPCSLRALAYMIAGHEMHHVAIIKERYL
ncbi:MAG: DinB family protein [Sphingobacteriales bacterium]|nr:MAG: DinB family protein [Sphingobacteriales bacterium]